MTRVDALSYIEVMSHYGILLYTEQDCELLDIFKDNIDGIQKKVDALYRHQLIMNINVPISVRRDSR